MNKKILKYQDFINEGFLNKVSSAIKSAVVGKRGKIKSIVNRMISVEKDFINKTDELTSSLYGSQNDYKSRSQSNPILRQQELMNKRALETFERAKNSEIESLKREVGEIVNNNKDLIDYYNEEAARGDKEIANYTYSISKAQRDSGYSNSHKQSSELEDLRNTLGSMKINKGAIIDPDGELEPIITIGSFKLEKPFSLVWEDFVNYIKDKPIEDLVYWKNTGQTLKFKGLREFDIIDKGIKASIKKITANKENNPSADLEIQTLQRDRDLNTNKTEEFHSRMQAKIELLQKSIKKQNERK